MVGFADHVVIIAADNSVRTVPLHADGTYYDALQEEDPFGDHSSESFLLEGMGGDVAVGAGIGAGIGFMEGGGASGSLSGFGGSGSIGGGIGGGGGDHFFLDAYQDEQEGSIMFMNASISGGGESFS